MVNLPQSMFLDVTTNQWGLSSSSWVNPNFSRETNNTILSVEQLILALEDDETRENALSLLSKRKSEDLGPVLWHSFGTISTILKEILSAYRDLTFSDRIASISNRVRDAIALLQCVTSNSSTKKLFLEAEMPYYLYPFLNTTSKEKHYDQLRLTSLCVIGALVKVDDPEVIHFFLKSKIFPFCLRCMEVGSVMSKTVATKIVLKILMQEEGMDYCCNFAERFYAVSHVLRTIVEEMAENITLLLLKHVIACFLRLSENPRCSNVLRQYIPIKFRDYTFLNLLREEPTLQGWLQQLFYNLTAGQQQPRHYQLGA